MPIRATESQRPALRLSGGPRPWRRARLRFGVCVLALTVAVGAHIRVAAQPGNVVIVVNREGPLTGATADQVRDIFLGRLRVVAGIRVQPVQLQGPVRNVVVQTLLGMSESEFQLYWMRRTYEDGLVPPRVCQTARSVLDHVERDKGAIGFVDSADLLRPDQVTVVHEVPAESGSR